MEMETQIRHRQKAKACVCKYVLSIGMDPDKGTDVIMKQADVDWVHTETYGHREGGRGIESC